MLIALAFLFQAVQPTPALSVRGTPPGAYTVTDTTGRITDPLGVSATLRARQGAPLEAGSFGALSGSLPADTLRGRRVRVSGEIRTRDAGGASLWLRMDGGGRMLLLDNGAGRAIRGTAGWTAFDVMLPVPKETERVIFGLLLNGGGEASVRRLRVEALAATSADAPLAPEAQAQLDTAIALVRRSSLWRDTVSWSFVEPQVRALAAGSTTARDVYPAIRLLLSRLGDHHSFVMESRATSDWSAGRATNLDPVVRTVGDSVGYVSVPGYSGGAPDAIRKYAERMHALLLEVAPRVRCGWIVDLRQDTGGNMYPMLGGLRPFLGDGTLGSFEGPTRSAGAPWDATRIAVVPPATLAPLESAFVAVLTGPRTASSGEVVTVSFRGRPRTRSFGQPTAGLTTGNSMFPLPDGGSILLTTSVYVDRTGRRYGASVLPDESISPPSAGPGSRDETLDRAQGWLAASTGCRSSG